MAKQIEIMAAIYCRLSRDDGGDAESNSIGNQRDQLTKYANEHDFIIYSEYVDDGISGTTFERDGFKRMIADIEEGKVGIVLCKDLSRLGRNNALVAYYTELFFPERDIRLICINDAIDTFHGENEIMAFKSVINEYYARDISKKIRSSYKVLAEKGCCISSCPPYGYVKSPGDIHKLIVDEEAAAVVRRIFQMKADGMRDWPIASVLCREQILVPSVYKLRKFGYRHSRYNEERPYDWESGSVRNILGNRIYTGDMVNHRRYTKSFKNRKLLDVPESEWIIVESTHEAIVDRELFDKVQTLLKIKTRDNKTHTVNIFASLIKCADCGHNLSYQTCSHSKNKAGRFVCITYTHSSTRSVANKLCTMHNTSYQSIYDMTLSNVNQLISQRITKEDILKRLGEHKAADSTLPKKVTKLKKRDRELQTIIERIVEQNALGELTKSSFARLYAKFIAEQESVLDELAKAESELATYGNNKVDVDRFLQVVSKYTTCTELTRELLLDLIDKIVVHEATGNYHYGTRQQTVEFHYKFIGKLDI